MKWITTVLILALKAAVLIFAALATYGFLFISDVRTDIDREAFAGCTFLIAIVAWRVLLRLLFGRSKPKEETSMAAA